MKLMYGDLQNSPLPDQYNGQLGKKPGQTHGMWEESIFTPALPQRCNF